MGYAFETLTDAAEYARNQKWSHTTVSIGLAVMHFNTEIVYHFNRKGDVFAWTSSVTPLAEPSRAA